MSDVSFRSTSPKEFQFEEKNNRAENQAMCRVSYLLEYSGPEKYLEERGDRIKE